jgi:glyoxylase-like metal-dependent hydrolase (beta-lactamase superfamily II)
MVRGRFIHLVLFCSLSGSCVVTTHPVEPAQLGVSRGSDAMLALIDQPGPLRVNTVASADWAIDRSGLINLESREAKEAKLKDGLEPVQIYFHAVRHPQRGLFIIDTGVEHKLRDDPDHAVLHGMLASAFGGDRMKVLAPLGDYLRAAHEPLRGVFLTHLHADHILGMPDVPRGTPIYTARGEAEQRALMNVLVQGVSDRLLANQTALQEWTFKPDPNGRFRGVIDVFGDGSLWALFTPGHTAGSMSFVARSVNGPVLLTGDTCHTSWGWEHDVEPGTYTADRAANRESLERLRRLAREHPKMSVRLGHQTLPGTVLD